MANARYEHLHGKEKGNGMAMDQLYHLLKISTENNNGHLGTMKRTAAVTWRNF
jgi:hypothetical protein